MLIQNQKVLVSWTNSNYNHYINKGYKFTKMRDKFYVNVEDLSYGSSMLVDVKCDFCGNIIKKMYSNYMKELNKNKLSCCNKCKGNKTTKTYISKNSERMINEFNELCKNYGYIPITTKDEYCSMKTPLKFICLEHGEQSIYLNNMRTGSGCKICGKIRTKKHHMLPINEVEKKVKSKNNSKLLNPEDYINEHVKNLKVECGSCHRIYTTSLNNYNYLNTGRCPKCNKSQSVGEWMVEKFLLKYNILYEKQKRFKDCKDILPLPFDFYLPNYNTCIEFDGEQHYRPAFGQKEYLNTVKHDKTKNQYCLNNKMDLIRIPYFEQNNIDKILMNKLEIENIA